MKWIVIFSTTCLLILATRTTRGLFFTAGAVGCVLGIAIFGLKPAQATKLAAIKIIIMLDNSRIVFSTVLYYQQDIPKCRPAGNLNNHK